MKRDYQIDVIIPSYHPGPDFAKLLKGLRAQSYPVRDLIVVNTEKEWWEKNGMGELEDRFGLTVRHVEKKDFDHGRTRAEAAALSDADLLLFMTQDALPKNETMVECLAQAFDDELVAVAYGRQLPAAECREIERYTRSFNYPDTDDVKTREDIPRLGIKTYFASNVCAAYRREIYERLGGFIRHTIFNEDMIFAGKAVQAGYKVAYCSRARVVHSHNYSPVEYLRRNFDLGVSQADHPEVFEGIRSESEGMRLVKRTACHFIRSGKPWLLPELVVSSGFKLIGYRLGKGYRRLPRWLIYRLTMNRDYWNLSEM